jgi:hypothetical protein
VTHTAPSSDQARPTVAAEIGDYLANLPGDVDYHVGVMLAHGLDQYSGALYTAGHQYPVLVLRTSFAKAPPQEARRECSACTTR